MVERLRAPTSGVDLARDVPQPTLDAVRVLQAGVDGNFYADAGEVERRFATLPPRLAASLFSFQREGVRFALQRNGRCLIADEVRVCVCVVCVCRSKWAAPSVSDDPSIDRQQMGTGKTLQALAAMACYREEWPLLIVVPASLRLVWAEAAEAWLPFLRPTDIKVRRYLSIYFIMDRVIGVRMVD